MNKINVYAYHGSFSTIREAAFAEANIDWLDSGNPLCDICTESFAAYKLYDYLKKAELDYVSLIDNLSDAEANDLTFVIAGKNSSREIFSYLGLKDLPNPLSSKDGYIIRELPGLEKRILLYGNSRIAVLYAMYHYLKTQGFAFISPDEYGFVIPKLEKLTPLNDTVVEEPDYKTRGFLSGYSDDTNEQFLEWMIANRLDNMSLHEVKNVPFVKKLGIKISGGGHKAMYEYLPADQPDPNYIPAPGEPPKTYFETHPEWFALRNGKREAGVNKDAAAKGYYTGNNFCMSNKDAVKEFCKNFLNSIIGGSLKDADFINVWPLDNGKWCECEECAKLGNYTRQILLVAYELMKAIKDAQKKGHLKRDILLIVPAYHETLPGPDKPLPEDFDYDMITVNLFTIERCYVHDLFDERCTEANTILADRIREWTMKEDWYYKGDLVIGEYFNVSSFASIPVVLADRIAKDMPDYYKWGARHFNFMHMISDSWGAKIINNNLYAALLWDIDLDVEAFIDQMLNVFYEQKAADVKSILKKVEKALENCKYIFHYQFVDGVINALKRNITKDKPFVSKHVQFDKILDDPNAGIDFESGYAMLKEAYAESVMLYEGEKEGAVKERLWQLKTHLEYGTDLYTIYRLILLYSQAHNKGENESCKKIAKEMKDLNEQCTAIHWALKGYKSERMFFDSLAAASWQIQLYERIIEQEALTGAKAELTL
jgi:hypothetical protein